MGHNDLPGPDRQDRSHALTRRSFVRTTAGAAAAGGLGLGASGQAAADEGIVNEVGRLQVQDGHVCAEDGSRVTLGGMSFFWSNWAGQYYSADVVDYLVDEFQVDVVRAACGVGEEGGYQVDPGGEMAKVRSVVDRAIERDVYVIVDFHLEGDAWPYHDQAQQFFTEIAQEYGDQPHLIYEPWNEPTEQSADDIREFCQSVADTIRDVGSDNLIVCGNSTWSQNPHEYSIDDPNAAYTFHAYPDAEYGDAHMNAFETNVTAAMDQGNAVFVTEFGAQYDDHDRTQEFIDQCQEMDISMVAWSVNDKDEPWSIFTNGTNSLTAIGQYYRDQIRNWPEPDVGCDPPEIEPYVSVDGEQRMTDEVEVEPDAEVTFSPRPTDGGSWSWTGPDVATDGRELTITATEGADGTYTATYTNDCGESASHEFDLQVIVVDGCEAFGAENSAQVDGRTVCDVNGDDLYRDVTGDAEVGQDDVVHFFENQHRDAWKRPELFDFSGSGSVGHGDVVALFEYVSI